MLWGYNVETLTIEDKSVQIFPAGREDSPLIILHTVQEEGEKVYRAVKQDAETDFSFAAIGNLNWDDEMSPWEIPPLFRGDTPCTGGADAYLEKLTGRILPGILGILSGRPSYMALTGYSLAGLFAVYALYHTDLFSRIASASGSFWYPDFMEYTEREELKRKPDCIYFSLGDKEAKARNRILQSVEENTRSVEKRFREMGISTVLEMNPGNHFRDTEERMAKGIRWILEQDMR